MNRGMSAPALWLLGRLAHRNEPLAGDLVEQFRDGRSSALALGADSLRDRHGRVPAATRACRAQSHADRSDRRRVARVEETHASPGESEQPGGRRRRPRADDDGISSEHRRAGRLVVRDWWNRLRPCTRDDACLPAPPQADGDRWSHPHRAVKRSLCLTRNAKRTRKNE